MYVSLMLVYCKVFVLFGFSLFCLLVLGGMFSGGWLDAERFAGGVSFLSRFGIVRFCFLGGHKVYYFLQEYGFLGFTLLYFLLNLLLFY